MPARAQPGRVTWGRNGLLLCINKDLRETLMQKKCADYANVGAGVSDKMHPATELEETASSPWLQLDCGGTDVYANICRSARLNKNISMRDIKWPNQIDELENWIHWTFLNSSSGSSDSTFRVEGVWSLRMIVKNVAVLELSNGTKSMIFLQCWIEVVGEGDDDCWEKSWYLVPGGLKDGTKVEGRGIAGAGGSGGGLPLRECESARFMGSAASVVTSWHPQLPLSSCFESLPWQLPATRRKIYSSQMHPPPPLFCPPWSLCHARAPPKRGSQSQSEPS